ncbi:hypothetical protein FITA111629_08730 [Filibacter tadaridae]|uniref:Uncharacterized protein n=1 Tax=Filibacter tadaridae TaxID=2483811 RepID=A0A3P5WIR1_9BACL|nr:hypothetical protein [Filibacter tadaridae]VDC21578.1 hypothetical protein FILTAD_00582 [Filibacter tadaridae]
MEFKGTTIQLVDGSGTIVVPNGILIVSDRVCAIYDMDEEDFKFVYTTRFEMKTMLVAEDLRMKD